MAYKFGDTKRMPCGSSQCENQKFTLWVWIDGGFSVKTIGSVQDAEEKEGSLLLEKTDVYL